MEQVLNQVADSLGIDHREKRPSPDYLWSKDNRLVIAIEHENNFQQNILMTELPSLLRTEASLRVLITYPPKLLMPANEMALKLDEELRKRLTPERNPSFLFLVAPAEWAGTPEDEPWAYHLWEFQLNKTNGEI